MARRAAESDERAFQPAHSRAAALFPGCLHSEPPRVSDRVRATARPALSERLQRSVHGPAGHQGDEDARLSARTATAKEQTFLPASSTEPLHESARVIRKNPLADARRLCVEDARVTGFC